MNQISQKKKKDKDSFYDNLQDLLGTTKNGEKTIIMGDLKTEVKRRDT